MGGGEGVVSDMTESRKTDDGVPVNIRCSNGSKFSVHIALDSTVRSFKSVLAQRCDIPVDQQRLIYKGRILKDDQSLQSYGFEAEHTVHLVRGFAPAPSTVNPNATNDDSPNTAPSSAADIGSNGGALGGPNLGSSLFSGLGMNPIGGSGGIFESGFPNFEQMQQQLTQNPNIMRELMNMPVFQNLLNNPEIMHNLIMSNPQMREIIDRNPELAHILNDPSTLRQTLEAARNPELMREMMRNTDRAMSNIESSPEGFNMLRRMYETVQEPFLNATTMAGDSRNSTGPNPFEALLGNQGRAQAQDQSINPSDTAPNSTTGSPAPNSNPLPNPWATVGAGGVQTNHTMGSSPLGATRQFAPAVIRGFGVPQLERMLATIQDANSPNQLLQNPAISQMMQSLLSNPQYMNQIMDLNPQLRNMFDSNPQIREMIQNPEFIRQLASPGTMQLLMTLQQSLLSHLGQQHGNQEPGQTGGGAGALNNPSLETLMNMFGGLGAGGLTVPGRSDVPAEELYATQLAQLQEMGFFDREENVRALIATSGNVHAAVERLLGSPAQ